MLGLNILHFQIPILRHLRRPSATTWQIIITARMSQHGIHGSCSAWPALFSRTNTQTTIGTCWPSCATLPLPPVPYTSLAILSKVYWVRIQALAQLEPILLIEVFGKGSGLWVCRSNDYRSGPYTLLYIMPFIILGLENLLRLYFICNIIYIYIYIILYIIYIYIPRGGVVLVAGVKELP